MAIGDLCQGAVVGPRAHAYFSGVKRGGAEGSKRAECVCASGEGLVVWGSPSVGRAAGEGSASGGGTRVHWWQWAKGRVCESSLCFNCVRGEWLKQDTDR